MTDIKHGFIPLPENIGKIIRIGPVELIACHSSVKSEVAAARAGVALFDRNHRGLLEITGRDRLAWLNNLTTRSVKNLQPGDGEYSFFLTAKGRIVFDANVLVIADSVLLDLDRRFVSSALSHLNKYVITEDVRVADRSDEFHRIGTAGPRADVIRAAIDPGGSAAPALLQSAATETEWGRICYFRSAFCGLNGHEWLVLAAQAVAFRRRMSELPLSATLAGYETENVLRIEAGIPWPVSEIHEDVLPAETGQFERAVHFNRGCYLGQEVVERMRSRGALAKALVGVTWDGASASACPCELHDVAGSAVGTLTSAAFSPTLGYGIGLGYVKTAAANPGADVRIGSLNAAATGRIAALPFVKTGGAG